MGITLNPAKRYGRGRKHFELRESAGKVRALAQGGTETGEFAGVKSGIPRAA